MAIYSHVFLKYSAVIRDAILGVGRKPFICQTLIEHLMGTRHQEQPFLSCLETSPGGSQMPPPSVLILLGATLGCENNAHRGVNCPHSIKGSHLLK